MSTFALTRLVTAGSRGSRLRLVGIAAGITVGVMLLLLLWGASNGLTSRSERSTWTTLYSSQAPVQLSSTTELADDQVAANTNTDHFKGHIITRVNVAATSGSVVRVPGVGHAPGPGSYFASPALVKLIDSVPADQLGARYGERTGVIADSALAGPDALVVVVGQAVPHIALADTATVVTHFAGYAFASVTYRTMAIVGGIAILFPVLLLIGIVTELGAAARTERFATIRLIGATPRTAARIAAVETSVTALAGAMAGSLLAWLLAPLVARLSIDGGSFFAGDLHVDPITTLIIVAATVAAATAMAWYRTLKAGIGPLGASRQRRERRPRILGLLPLLIGVAIMVVTTIASITKQGFPRTDIILIAGFVLTSIGMITAGPILTSWVSRLARRNASNAAGVITMNRIRLHPRATFRAVSGLVIAVFMVSVFAAAITTVAHEAEPVADAHHLPLSTLVAQIAFSPSVTAEALSVESRSLERVPGVGQVAVGSVYSDKDGLIFTAPDAEALGLTAPPGSAYVTVSGYLNNEPARIRAVDIADPGKLVPAVLLIPTNGKQATIERARTAAEVGEVPLYDTPSTRIEQVDSNLLTSANKYADLANLGILIATLISAVSLAVSTTASILDRKRVLGLLRLMGMPVSTLHRMIIAETALPLATVFAGCIGLGFLMAWTLIAGLTEGRRTIAWPDPAYYAVLGLSLVLALVAVLATFRTARHHTSTVATRFE